MIRSLTAWLHDLATDLHHAVTRRTRRIQWCHCGAIAAHWHQCAPCRTRSHPTCWCSIRPSLGDDLHNRT